MGVVGRTEATVASSDAEVGPAGDAYEAVDARVGGGFGARGTGRTDAAAGRVPREVPQAGHTVSASDRAKEHTAQVRTKAASAK
jgi:hypothetical protein